jgi:4,4'-diaponeurosporenoate glycosyltransferase
MHIIELIIAFIFWTLGFLFLFRIPRCQRRSGESKLYPSVSIIVPARNEENNLPILLESLRNQGLSANEVIVVIGPSEDKTWEVARREGVTVILSEPMPSGWLGKPWACYQGAKAAKGELLIFLDADTFLEKEGLKNIVNIYLERDGVVTIQPFHKTKHIYEQFSAYFNIIGMAGMGTFTVLGSLLKPIGLFGPCVVMSKKYYFEIGGHLGVKGEVVEDLALGNRIKKQQVPIYCYGGKGTISFRMYPGGIGQLIEGWSKGFATGAVKTSIPILIATIVWIGGSLSTTRYLSEALINLNMLTILVWGAAYIAYAAQIWWMFRRVGTFNYLTALFYPISLLFFLLVFLLSFFLIFIQRSVKWKGVKINLKDKSTRK